MLIFEDLKTQNRLQCSPERRIRFFKLFDLKALSPATASRPLVLHQALEVSPQSDLKRPELLSILTVATVREIVTLAHHAWQVANLKGIGFALEPGGSKSWVVHRLDM